MITLKCSYCGKIIKKFPSQIATHSFCSNECYHLFSRKTDTIYYENDYAYILLAKNNVYKKVLFDKEDVDKITTHKWHLHLYKKDNRYDVCTNSFGSKKGNNKRHYILLSRFLMDCPKNLTIDHINHNTMDNRKSNLRICTVYTNNMNKTNNTSGCVGVCWDKSRSKWHVMFKEINLGRFKTFKEAVFARKKAEFKFAIHSYCHLLPSLSLPNIFW